jgi:hypothetical protein
MSGRVGHVIHVSTPVTHHAHVWGSLARTPPNSEKEGPQTEAELRQQTTTTRHDKIPSLVRKRKFCPSQKLFHPPPVDNDRKRLLKVSILTKILV